jgi:hypothetical protein
MANLLGRAIVSVLNKSGALEIIKARAFADLRKRIRLLEKRGQDEFPDVQRRIRRLEELLRDGPTQVASINFDHDRIEQHIKGKIGECQLELFPLPHIVVDDILPGEFYEALVGNMPSPDCFPLDDPVKRNWKPQSDLAPPEARRLWRYLDAEITAMLIPLLLNKFSDAIGPHYQRIFGEDFADDAARLPMIASKGRLMLRRPGYRLRPHCDPKDVTITVLLYFPKEGMSDSFGTQLFETDNKNFVASFRNTYFPESDGGIRCTLAKTVPFRRNSMLAFLNSGGAHGAEIPINGTSPDLERYSYQVYIRPDASALEALIERLPVDRQLPWRLRSMTSDKERVSAQVQ